MAQKGRRGRKRKEAKQVGQRANQKLLVMLISVLFGKSLEIISKGFPYSSHRPVLVAVVLMAVVLKTITMVVMLLMLLRALTALMVLSMQEVGKKTGTVRRWSGLEAVCRQRLR